MHLGKSRGTEIRRFIETGKLVGLSLGEQIDGNALLGNGFFTRVRDDLTYIRNATAVLLVSRGVPDLRYISRTIMDTENFYKTVCINTCMYVCVYVALAI